MRILIVEDEWESRDGLAALIRSGEGGHHILTAASAEEGLRVLREYAVDLIFLDIKMPGMDGLSMLEAIRRRDQDVSVVILSAYDHFPYAQRAIRLGVFDYIVKPYSAEVIARIVRHVAEQAAGKSEPGGAYGLYLSSALTRWLQNPSRFAPALSQQLGLAEGHPWPGSLHMMTPMIGSADQARFYDHASASLIGNLRTAMDRFFAQYGHSLTFASERDILTVCILTGERSPDAQALDAHLTQCAEDARLRLGVELCATVVSEPDILNGVQRAYQQACSLSKYAFYLGADDVVLREGAPIDPGRAVEENELKLLYAAIREGKSEQARARIERIFTSATRPPWMPPQRLIFALHSGLTELLNSVAGSMPLSAHEAFNDRLHETAEYAARADALRTALSDVCADVAEVILSSRLNKSASIMSRCIDHLGQHYGDKDLTQETMAHAFHFSASYFGALFKSTTGQTFVQYLLNLRIDRARDMLSSTQLKVYAVSDRVGFSDVKYFIRVFKKITGMSPNQYRSATPTNMPKQVV